jgi:hypothetical protein
LSSDGLIVASTGLYPLSADRYIPVRMEFDNADIKYATLLNWINWNLGDDVIKKSIEYSDFVPPQWMDTRVRRQVQRFNILLKDKRLLSNWLASEAETFVALHLLLETESTSLLEAVDTSEHLGVQYFDGAVMMTYESPSRVAEDMWNRDNPDLAVKHGYDPDVVNYKIETSLDVRMSSAENGGRGVYVTQHIDKGSYIGLEQLVHSIEILPNALALLDSFSDVKSSEQGFSNKHNFLIFCFEEYGWFDDDLVSKNGPFLKCKY